MKFPLIVLALMVAACSSPAPKERVNGYTAQSKTAEDSVFDEVMHAHDRGMSKMGRLNSYKIRIDSVLQATGKHRSIKLSFATLRKNLDVAEDGMEKWMAEFNLDSAQNKGPRRMVYLQKQRDIVDSVSERLVRIVAEADSLFKK